MKLYLLHAPNLQETTPPLHCWHVAVGVGWDGAALGGKSTFCELPWLSPRLLTCAVLPGDGATIGQNFKRKWGAILCHVCWDLHVI